MRHWDGRAILTATCLGIALGMSGYAVYRTLPPPLNRGKPPQSDTSAQEQQQRELETIRQHVEAGLVMVITSAGNDYPAGSVITGYAGGWQPRDQVPADFLPFEGTDLNGRVLMWPFSSGEVLRASHFMV